MARRPPFGVRRPARRQAADAERDRRPGRGVRGGHRAGDAAGLRGRQPDRPARGGAAPDRAAAREVLGLQAHPDDGRRGAGVPGRQRLRRGVRHAAALPRVAAELDLGGLRQRQRPRRAPRPRPRARGARGVAHRGRSGPGRGPAPGPRHRGRALDARGHHHPRGLRPPAGRPDGGLPAGLAAGAVRSPGDRRRVLRDPARWRLQRHPRDAPGRDGPEARSSSGPPRSSERSKRTGLAGNSPRLAGEAFGCQLAVSPDVRGNPPLSRPAPRTRPPGPRPAPGAGGRRPGRTRRRSCRRPRCPRGGRRTRPTRWSP